MKPLTQEARGFVEGITKYIRQEGKDASLLPKVESLFQKVTDHAIRRNMAKVESAVELTLEEKTAIRSLVAKLLDHPVELESTVNPKLLGGVKIAVADWILDTSLRSRLDRMAHAITNP